MALEITYAEAKRLTLDYLRDWLAKLPVAQRNAPVIIFDMRSWTIPQLISQIQMDSPIGKRFVYYYIGSLKRYVIKG